MKYEIKKGEGILKEHHGYFKSYLIDFKFKNQKAQIRVEFFKSNEQEVRINSITDGYHWLQFFLSQKDNALKMEENNSEVEKTKAADLFKPYNIGYEQEDKETAWLIYPKNMKEDDLLNIIAKEVGNKFSNRERFFID